MHCKAIQGIHYVAMGYGSKHLYPSEHPNKVSFWPTAMQKVCSCLLLGLLGRTWQMILPPTKAPPRCPWELDTPTTSDEGNRSARNKVFEPWPLQAIPTDNLRLTRAKGQIIWGELGLIRIICRNVMGNHPISNRDWEVTWSNIIKTKLEALIPLFAWTATVEL